MNTRVQALEQGKESFNGHAWGAAFFHLSAADRESPLDPGDLAQLAQSAYLIGNDAAGAEFLGRAHQAFLSLGQVPLAARCAFWLGFSAMLNGESAKGGGWLSRAGRLLEDQPDCAETGYLLLAKGYRLFHEGDPVVSHDTFVQAAGFGRRFGDKDLMTMALQGQGRSLIRQGEIRRGVALLDEAMVAVTAGDVSPLNAGGVYCSVLEGCGEIFDLRRAQEWTSELEKWCASQPDLVPYRGHCMVRRAELLHMRGAWPEALEWAQRAVEWVAGPVARPGAGSALYQLGEIHRARGDFDAAEQVYRAASEGNPSAGAGPALLQLAQGRVESALVTIRRARENAQELASRSRILDAYVEIALAAGDVVAARSAAQELQDLAVRNDVAFLRALSSRAFSSVLLAEGKAEDALAGFRESWHLWCELGAPYEASRMRMHVAEALIKLADFESARAEIEAARQIFANLGASTDLARAEKRLSSLEAPSTSPGSSLTERETQVLKLVASGLTNRAIADKLKISEKTVARHLSNIFNKLDLSSRTAAAAYAYDHNLVESRARGSA